MLLHGEGGIKVATLTGQVHVSNHNSAPVAGAGQTTFVNPTPTFVSTSTKLIGRMEEKKRELAQLFHDIFFLTTVAT